MSKGLLIVISGPSGAGKGTICKELLSKYNDISLSISATTRNPRPGEANGVNYFFISKDEFEQLIAKNELMEYAFVYGNYYGTPKKYVQDKLDAGEDVLLEIDIQGALKVKELFNDGVFIFILPPSMEELKNRITKRGTESEDDLLNRFKSASDELKYVFQYDYAVFNDSINLAVDKIRAIIDAEKCRVNRQQEIIKGI